MWQPRARTTRIVFKLLPFKAAPRCPAHKCGRRAICWPAVRFTTLSVSPASLVLAGDRVGAGPLIRQLASHRTDRQADVTDAAVDAGPQVQLISRNREFSQTLCSVPSSVASEPAVGVNLTVQLHRKSPFAIETSRSQSAGEKLVELNRLVRGGVDGDNRGRNQLQHFRHCWDISVPRQVAMSPGGTHPSAVLTRPVTTT